METQQEHALVDELRAAVAQLPRDGALDRVSELLAGIAPADEKAARETGVPVDLIRGDTPEEVAAHAKAIAAAYAKPAAPRVGEAGRFQRGDSGGSKTVDFVNRLTGNSKND